MTAPVTLQVSLPPPDHRLAQHLLPHQVRTWRGQVAYILLTVDLHRSGGRFADGWTEGRDRILALAHSVEIFARFQELLAAGRFWPRDYILENLTVEKYSRQFVAIVDSAQSEPIPPLPPTRASEPVL